MTEVIREEDAVAGTTGRTVLGGGMWYLGAQAAPQLVHARRVGGGGAVPRRRGARAPELHQLRRPVGGDASRRGLPARAGAVRRRDDGPRPPGTRPRADRVGVEGAGPARVRRRSHSRGRRARGRGSAGGLGARRRRDRDRDAAQRAERGPHRPAALARRLPGGPRDGRPQRRGHDRRSRGRRRDHGHVRRGGGDRHGQPRLDHLAGTARAHGRLRRRPSRPARSRGRSFASPPSRR